MSGTTRQTVRANNVLWAGTLLWGALIGLGGECSAQSPMPIRLNDVATEAGVTLLNVSGGPTKDFILKVAGSGAAFFDYDSDLDMDLLLVNGSTFENLRTGGDPDARSLFESGEWTILGCHPSKRP